MISYHMEGWNLAIFVWYWDGSSDYLMVFVRFGLKPESVSSGFCFVLFGWCVFALFFRTVRLDLELSYTLCALRRFDCFYLRSFRAKQMNRSVASQYIGLTLFLRIWPWTGFPGFPFSVFLSGWSRFTERASVFALDLLFLSPFLGAPLYYHNPRPLSSTFLSFWAWFSIFFIASCLFLIVVLHIFIKSEHYYILFS